MGISTLWLLYILGYWEFFLRIPARVSSISCFTLPTIVLALITLLFCSSIISCTSFMVRTAVASGEVTTLNGKSQGIAEASDGAMRVLDELGDINRKAVEAVHVIYKQTNTTNDSAQKIREATTLISL